MHSVNMGSFAIVVFIGIFIIFCGCISQQKENTTLPTILIQQSPTGISSQPSGDLYWIQIDPVEDFHSESPFNITGTTKLNITGTTNYPDGSLFWVNIIEEERVRSVLSNVVIPVEKKSNGLATFSYNYDMKGNPPAHYRIEIRKANQNITAIARFNITSREPWWWINIYPVGETHAGENLTIRGTTNLPVGTEITVSYSMLAHSCTPSNIPDKLGERTFCGGSCRPGEVSSYTVKVVEGVGGANSWNATLNTTGWCMEYYGIGVDAGKGKNATHAGLEILHFPSASTTNY